MLVVTCIPLGMAAQEVGTASRSVETEQGRVVFPTNAAISVTHAHRILRILESEDRTPGVPESDEREDKVTIGLAIEMPRGDADGWSLPREAMLILPLEASLRWDNDRISRVLRHELAHIRLSSFLNHKPIPSWFQEGFAGWAASGLTQERKWRVWIEVARLRKLNRRLPRLVDMHGAFSKLLAYDFYVSFFDFVDTAWPGVVSTGRLAVTARTHDVEHAFSIAVGVPFSAVEDEWHRQLAMGPTVPSMSPVDSWQSGPYRGSSEVRKCRHEHPASAVRQ